ncbi:MAG: hypothetical protein ACLUZZ_01570 [Alistipes inops]
MPTDFKADEVTMQVISKGGKSVLADDEILSATVLPDYTAMAGLGKFNASDLRKQLTGKMASVSPSSVTTATVSMLRLRPRTSKPCSSSSTCRSPLRGSTRATSTY